MTAITVHKLPNGMTAILEENHARPVISFNALVKVGSAFEADHEAGICHFIEHMLFKGTPTYPVGEIARSIEAAGGEINAYTSFDQTVFYVNMASMFAEKGLAILADAIQNPTFDPDELTRECEVILEEIRREKDHPARMMSEEIFKSAYTRHPYGRPIIGFPETVKGFTHEDLSNFYRRWYSPKNMVFIVVGDFDTLEMLDTLRDLFAGFDGPPPPPSLAAEMAEPQQKSPRLVIKEANIQSAHLTLAWHIPGITGVDVPALDVASHILGGSESSRLEQVIKEKLGLVHHINAYSYTPKDPGLLAASAVMGEAQAFKAIEAILQETVKLQEEPVRAAELSRAKLNIRSSEIYEKETVGGQAQKIAYFLATAGSHEFEERYYQKLQDVHVDEVLRVSQEYLGVNNMTAVLLVPSKSSWKKRKPELKKMITKQKPAPARTRARKKDAPLLHRMRLKNGITLIVRENHHLPLVAVSAVALGGLRFEKPANNGISALMARTITKGTDKRTAVRIAKDIERIAGHVEGFSGRNSVGLKSEFLSEHLRTGFEIFGDVLTHPAWDPKEVAKEKKFVLQGIRDQEDALGSKAMTNFLKALFPKHPYGMKSLGNKKSIQSITPRALETFYRHVFRPQQMVLSVAGDVNPEEIALLANEFLCDLPKGKSATLRIKKDPKPTKPISVMHHKKEKQQAHIVLGFQGATVKSKDRYAFTVLNNILAGQGGRLFLELRDKMGLAYVVASQGQEGIEPGYFAVYMGTEPTKVEVAIEGIKAELHKVATVLVSADELDRAKRYIVGTYELESQRNGALASAYALNQLYGLGIDEVERYPKEIMAITRKDVLAVAQKYLTLDAPVLSIIAPE